MWGYRSLGVCGKGASMSGLGGRRRAIWDLVSDGRAVGALPILGAKPFGYELQEARSVSNEGNLTNEMVPRYLQNCISGFGNILYFLCFPASLRRQIVEKGGAGFARIGSERAFLLLIPMT